jgi:hypothetical protein
MSEYDFTETEVNEAVAAELVADLQEAWQDKAAKEVPEAAHLKKHWHGNSKQEVLAQAKAMAESLKEATPSPSVTGGSPAIGNYHPGQEDELTEAREAARQNPSDANYSRYLRAKFADAGVPYPYDE